ncbi:MAG TPA: SgcJ/EcaC family oxidoreductase, partial [Herpetosiphonaceae bacterium]
MLAQPVAADEATISDPGDVAAVRRLLTQLYDSWGNADAFDGFFTEDADYIAFDGTHSKGRSAIAESHRPLFEHFLKGSRLFGEPPT